MKTVLLFVLISCACFAQTKQIDSLKLELKKDKKDKFLDYSALIDAYTKIHQVDSVDNYTNEITSYAKKLNSPRYNAMAFKIQSNLFILKKDYENAIKTANKSIEVAKTVEDNDELLASTYAQLGKIFYVTADAKRCIEFSEKALFHISQILKKDKPIILRQFFCNIFLVESYNIIGDYVKAQECVVSLKKLVRDNNLNDFWPMVIHSECKNLESLNRIDESIVLRLEYIEYVKRIDNVVKRNGNLCEGYYNIAELYNKIDKLELSEIFLDSSKMYIKDFVNKEYIMGFYKNLEADLSIKKNKLTHESIDEIINDSPDGLNAESLPFAISQKAKLLQNDDDFENAILKYEEAKNLYSKSGRILGYSQTLKNLITLLIETGQKEKALVYFNEYEKLKDQIFNREVANSLSDSQVQYETELKEEQIKTQDIEIQKQKIARNFSISGIGILVLIGGFTFWINRNKQKRNALKLENSLLLLQHNLTAMELQNLNTQLDPHEIKNLLASISPEIQEKAPDSYKKMLKLFNITKASLNNNSLTESLENQVQQIEDFLSLKKQSLFETLEYKIENKIENQETQLPRLILKNLVENSVKHGIKGKEGGGEIIVALEETNGFIVVSVNDTGKGRKEAISLDSGIGTTTYQKLFATLNQKNNESASFNIIDKEVGTLVEVKIPIGYNYN